MKFKKLGVLMLAGLFVFGTATSAFAASSNTATPGAAEGGAYQGSEFFVGPLDVIEDGDDNDNNIGNANETGEFDFQDDGVKVMDGNKNNDVIKSQGMRAAGDKGVDTNNQRTHGQYQANTNSCASCHQTHTGAAKDLLFKQGVYNTCAACHDGTLGFYNVFEGSTAGTFGGSVDGNASIHMATGDYSIGMAPGGNHLKKDALDLNAGNEDKAWTQAFDCAACHAPHGSYSDRLLHYNPNSMANTPVAEGGQKLVDMEIVTTLDAANGPDEVLFKTTAAGLASYKTYQDLSAGDAAAGLPTEGDVVVLMRKVDGAYVRDLTPWLYGYFMNRTTHEHEYYTFFKDAAKARLNPEKANIDVEYGKAYATGTGLVNANFADICPVYVVKFQGTVVREDANGVEYTAEITMPLADGVWNDVTDFGGIPIVTVDPDIYDEASKGALGYGQRIGKYCGTCHTDYLAGSVREYDKDKDGVYDWEDADQVAGTGMFSTAYRHTTNNDRYTCLKCHFAHGTDVSVMKDANDATITDLTAAGWTEADAKAYLLDQNASSALKRYTNMAVCWKCHTDSKATQLKNNDFFWSADNAVHGGGSGEDTDTEYGW